MLGNLKEFISVVQDGLTSNSNLRQTLQEVQKVTNLFKEKQKVVDESKVNYGAGGTLLEKYQQDWTELHENADKNAKAAEEVDNLILEVHELMRNRLTNSIAMAQCLSYIPGLTATIAQCMDSLKNIQCLMNTVEEELTEFEDIIERSKMENWKLDHHYHLAMYKEKKMAALEDVRTNLAKENTQQTYEREKRQLAELQSKREQSSLAFQTDVAKYLITGTVPAGPPATPKVTLEQIQLEEDRTDLEKFLES